jgi:4-alpha-glucanotransferase
MWGNPVYNWNVLKKTGYAWWLDRITHNAKLFDIMRLDHFRGFVYYWQFRAGDKTAAKGRWEKVPSEDFFSRVFRAVSSEQIIVEDLGYITANVRAIIEKFNLAGMRILLFGFGGDPKKNPHYLKNHIANSVVYTGTHDTNTARGWFENEAGKEQKKRLVELIGRKVSTKEAAWEMVKLALRSKSRLAIIPMQDILGFGTEARMNLPATTKNNWIWRIPVGQKWSQISEKLADLTVTFGRTKG